MVISATNVARLAAALLGACSVQPKAPAAAAMPAGSADPWEKVEREGRGKVLQPLGLTSTTKAHVDTKTASLKLSGDKKKQADAICKELQGALRAATSDVEKTTLHTRMESMLVDWGVAPRAAAMKPDYHQIARLLSMAAAVAE